ncbi:MAG: arginase [Proteobacteria bacterium]|nr:arginase [Pseudomonadota bacterium]
MKTVSIIGVPSDLGANMRGANIGPSAIRIAGLHEKLKVLGFSVDERGDILLPLRESISLDEAAKKYQSVIKTVCKELSDHVYESLKLNRKPIVLGGDHSIGIGTITGVSKFLRDSHQKLGLIWIDAHADMNTPSTTHTGNIHGMPLATVLGLGHDDLVNLGGFAPKIDPKNVALIGIRTLDSEEKDICKRSGIRYFTMREIDERGMHLVMQDALKVATDGTAGFHLSFDIDGMDPLHAPGVSTPVTGGISLREAHLALEMMADTGKLLSMEFVELNPMCDVEHKTARLVIDLVQSALGKSIV